jgi:hypothetical protein
MNLYSNNAIIKQHAIRLLTPGGGAICCAIPPKIPPRLESLSVGSNRGEPVQILVSICLVLSLLWVAKVEAQAVVSGGLSGTLITRWGVDSGSGVLLYTTSSKGHFALTQVSENCIFDVSGLEQLSPGPPRPAPSHQVFCCRRTRRSARAVEVPLGAI